MHARDPHQSGGGPDRRPAGPLDHALAAVLDDLPVDATVRVLGGGDPVAPGLRRVIGPEADEAADAVVCVGHQMSAAGEHAETLLAQLVDGLRPGGTLVTTFANALWSPGGDRHDGPRAWRPADVRRFLGARGVDLERLIGPGAATRAAGTAPAFDPARDAEPSLLGAAPVLLAVGRAPRSPHERSRVFFSTIATKTVAAATVTRRADGAVLVVHDVFKQHWTIPGGLVDDDEDPVTAAVRETREETGIDVEIVGLGGVFHALRPDRLVFVFRARPLRDHVAPAPIHAHEIDGAAWVSVDEALRRVPRYTAEHLTAGLGDAVGVYLQR